MDYVIKSLKQLHQVGATIISILQMKKLRIREVKLISEKNGI